MQTLCELQCSTLEGMEHLLVTWLASRALQLLQLLVIQTAEEALSSLCHFAPTCPTKALSAGLSLALTCALTSQSSPHLTRASEVSHCAALIKASRNSIIERARLDMVQARAWGHLR